MVDGIAEHDRLRLAPPGRPLQGLTVLVVEDSRFASDSLRLLCAASGARMRRAGTAAAAARHLAGYRPGAAIVDLWLPDGSGLDLIARMAAARPRVPVILGTSGEPATEDAARAAGADGFLPKPVASLVAFQTALLGPLAAVVGPLPDGAAAPARRPDPLALRDDLRSAAEALDRAAEDGAALAFAARFVAGLARVAGDAALAAAAEGLGGPGDRDGLGRLRRLLAARIARAGPI